MTSQHWSPDEVVGYEAAGDVVHALAALCTARISRETDPEVAEYWRTVRADRDRQWRALDPRDVQAVASFVAECRELVRALTPEAR